MVEAQCRFVSGPHSWPAFHQDRDAQLKRQALSKLTDSSERAREFLYLPWLSTQEFASALFLELRVSMLGMHWFTVELFQKWRRCCPTTR